MDYLIFSEMHMRKRIYFAPVVTTTYCMKNNKSSTTSLSLEMSVLARARAQLSNMLYISTHLSVPHGENIQKIVLYKQKLVLSMSRAEWTNGICLMWSRGRLISLSLPPCLSAKSDSRAPSKQGQLNSSVFLLTNSAALKLVRRVDEQTSFLRSD